jgi:endonuclease YncB( thermonuclease family)
MVILAVAVGLTVAHFWPKSAVPTNTKPDAPIEWNEVQEVPKPLPDALDGNWERRAHDEVRSEARPSTNADFVPTSSGRTEGKIDGQKIYVIDGDTFDLNGTRIRVAGIDAPETHPARCPREAALGAAATEKLAELLRRKPLWISGEKIDRYGRSVRTVRTAGEDVADAMIGSGLARNYDGKLRSPWC